MITAEGYSKDHSLIPEGVAITFGREMMENNGGYKAMIKLFLDTMDHSEGVWMHKMQLWPKMEIADVYIITLNRLWGRVKFGWFADHETFKYSPIQNHVQRWPLAFYSFVQVI